MNTKLSKHGDELALVIDAALLQQLNIDENTALEVSKEGDHLVVCPVRSAQSGMSFEEALVSSNERYAKTLKRLAE